MFWQYPCRTEGTAFERHAALPGAWYDGDTVHAYLGLPWATWIDLSRKEKWTLTGEAAMQRTLWRLGVQVAAARRVLAERGAGLRVHTVCQHIKWEDLVDTWMTLGITDLWLSHCPRSNSCGRADLQLTMHAWPLFAVNVEDPTRREGLVTGRPASERTLLASFIGAQMRHYLDDSRLQLAQLSPRADIVIRVNEEWHFEAAVYGQQIEGTAETPLPCDGSVAEYNRVLSNSVFALCPAGAGLNTLRLWEALATGSIPVLFDEGPRLPDEESLAGVDWDAIVVRVQRCDIADLAVLLEGIPAEERRQRQQAGWLAYARARNMLCFGASS